MENLVAREAYDVDETGYWKRLPVLGGLFAFLFGGFGFGLIFPLLFDWVGTLVFPQRPALFNAATIIIIGLSFGIIFGLAFGWVFPTIFRRKMASAMSAIYDGDPKIVPAPPSEKEFSYRLPCSWMKSDNFAVGGLLYLGKQSLMFVPHQENLAQHRNGFEIAPLNNVTLSLVQPRLNLLARLLTERPPSHIEIRWEHGQPRFLVPEAEITLTKIKRIIESGSVVVEKPL